MNKAFKKFKFRNIRSNIKQFISVIIIVFLSTMLLSGFIVNASTLSSSVNRFYAETNFADMWLYVDGVTQEDENFFESQNIKYNKRLYFETSITISNGQNKQNAQVYVGSGAISNPVIVSGWKGLLIDEHIAENNDIDFGIDEMTFTLNLTTENGIVPLSITQKITGKMNFVESYDSYSSFPIFIDEETFIYKVNEALNSLGVSEQIEGVPYNQILIKTNDYEATKQVIESYYEGASSNLLFIASREENASYQVMKNEISQAWKMIYVFPVIFLLVSVLVILTTVDQLIIQEKTKIGTLKSIGISDKKILGHYSSYGAIMCFFGSLVGIILGVLVIPNIMFVKYNLLYSLPVDYVKMSVPILWLLLMLLLIVLLGYLVSFATSYKILHKSPIECLRFDVNFSRKSLKSTKGRFAKMPLPLKMGARNIKLKPIRAVMASIGIAGCTALLLSGFGISNTLSNSINNDFGKVFKYDITSTYTSSNFKEQIEDVEGIESFESYTQTNMSVFSENKESKVNVYIIQENSNLCEIKISNDEVCLSKSVAEKLNVKVGETISIIISNKNVEFKVSKIIETSIYNGVYLCKDIGVDETISTHGVWVKCENGADISHVKDEINKINGTNSALTMFEMKDSANSQISSISAMTTTLKVFAILLAVVVLINFVILILKERIRELATLKVLGYSVTNIALSILIEMLFISLIGMAVGLLLGYPLLILILVVNKLEVINYIFYISPVSFILSILIIVLTVVLIALYCFYKVIKINMVESLKTIE